MRETRLVGERLDVAANPATRYRSQAELSLDPAFAGPTGHNSEERNGMSSPEHKAKIWNMIKPMKVGMLATEVSGALRARPMHLVQDAYDGTLWFFTSKDSAKVFEIRKDRDVCLTFASEETETYVSLTGRARIIEDSALIEKFWNPFVAAWFPAGRQDPQIALIEVHVSAGEHWDSTSSKVLQLFEVAKANLTDSRPDLGENEQFGSL